MLEPLELHHFRRGTLTNLFVSACSMRYTFSFHLPPKFWFAERAETNRSATNGYCFIIPTYCKINLIFELFLMHCIKLLNRKWISKSEYIVIGLTCLPRLGSHCCFLLFIFCRCATFMHYLDIRKTNNEVR